MTFQIDTTMITQSNDRLTDADLGKWCLRARIGDQISLVGFCNTRSEAEELYGYFV